MTNHIQITRTGRVVRIEIECADEYQAMAFFDEAEAQADAGEIRITFPKQATEPE